MLILFLIILAFVSIISIVFHFIFFGFKISSKLNNFQIKSPSINPIYNDLIENCNITKLKIDIVKSVSQINEKQISDFEKKNYIYEAIGALPDLVKSYKLKNETSVYIFPSSFKYTLLSEKFKEISKDLKDVLVKMGITSAKIVLDGGGIEMDMKQLMDFCDYERLLPTIELLK